MSRPVTRGGRAASGIWPASRDRLAYEQLIEPPCAPGLSGVARPSPPGETFNPVRGEFREIALPAARGFNDPLGHKLARCNVAGSESEAGLFVGLPHDPRRLRIERRLFY